MKSRGNILISRKPKNFRYSRVTLADGNSVLKGWTFPPAFGDQMFRNVRKDISFESSLNFRHPLGDFQFVRFAIFELLYAIRHFCRMRHFSREPFQHLYRNFAKSPFSSKLPLFKGPLRTAISLEFSLIKLLAFAIFDLFVIFFK